MTRADGNTTSGNAGQPMRPRDVVYDDEAVEDLIDKALEVAQFCWERNKVDHYDLYMNLGSALLQKHRELQSIRQYLGTNGTPPVIFSTQEETDARSTTEAQGDDRQANVSRTEAGHRSRRWGS